VSRSQLLPGLSLRVGDMLDGLFRIESLVDAERSCLHLHGSQVADGKPVMIQILAASGPEADQACLKFMSGARKASALKGPHVARVVDVGVTPEGYPYVVRERPPARSLALLLEEHPALGNEEAVDVALDVCDALAEAHRHGLFHGDLGTRSVHLGWSATGPLDVKVIDLGIGSALAQLALRASSLALPVRAPEQLVIGAKLDARADVFAVGAVLYTMLAGAPPFAAESPSAIDVAVANDEPASLAGVPDALAELVESCLSKDPAKRPESMSALAEALAPYATRATETLSRIRAYGAPLGRTVETPIPQSRLLEVDDEDDQLPDSSPTIVAREGYESLVKHLTDADTTAKRDVIAAVALAAESGLDIPITVEPSVRDLSARSLEKSAEPKPEPKKPEPKKPEPLKDLPKVQVKAAEPRRPEPTPEPPIAVAKSVPPMTIERDMPTVIVARKRNRLQMTGLAIAGAALAVGVLIGSQSAKLGRKSEPAAAAPQLPPAAMVVGQPAAQPTTESTPASALPQAAIAATDLPSAQEPKAPSRGAKPRASGAPSAAPPSAAKPASEESLVKSASAPVPASKPEPKAHEDDLRRFLDDRR
jgi:eukaryotic-like serine/threonine-protein kinase